MNRWMMRVMGLGILTILLLVGLRQEARAQQDQEGGPGLDQLFGLTSYQGPEELPYFGEAPGVDEQAVLTPAVNVPGSQIVFQSLRNLDNWNIWSVDGSGALQAPVATSSGHEIQPSLNRGGTKIVFSMKKSGEYNIFSINPDGSGQKQLTRDNNDNVYPAWSPDGTRIAFTSYRDGQAEVYSMNADGSGQTRLTWYASYDGLPTWSPDGTRIAFVSDRVGNGGIWVMNSDGSSPTLLREHRASYYPSWSPDGSRIAYNADDNNDGWLEMWVMNADGASSSLIYTPPNLHEAWVGSWSPDGQNIAFSEITYIYYHGNWYWTESYLKAWNASNGQISLIIEQATEWLPDWQTLDLLAPTSYVLALPAQSPAPIPVTWTGYDNGPTGIKSYDVQVKEGEAGTWTDWRLATQATTGSYPGIGGHTYYFRARARDNAFNTEPWPADYQALTTVENYPPNSRVHPLPIYTRNGTAIEWSGVDVGGSGILTYDIQYRDSAGGDWTDWQVGTSLTEALFSGVAGHTYYFRSAAIDNASNLEAWPAGDGDTQTLLYSWGISGQVADNTGLPISSAYITTTPGVYAPTPSNLLGYYRAVVVENLANYTAAWYKPGYGSLPPTTYDFETDAQVDIVLPPLDNVLQDSDFEAGSDAWTYSGEYTPVISDRVSHTGESAAFLGSLPGRWNDRETVLDERGEGNKLGFDAAGNVYAVWARGDMHPPQVQYAMRYVDGSWTEPVSIATFEYSTQLNLVVEPNGIVHVIYNNGAALMYTCLDLDDEWSTPISISDPYVMPSVVNFVRDASGVLHVAWNGRITSNSDQDFFYNRRDLNGNWGTPYVMNDNYYTWLYSMALDSGGNAHFVWAAAIPMGANLYVAYMRRAADGTWSAAQDISGMPGEPRMAINQNGVVHVIWIAEANKYGYYTYRDLAGNWSAPEEIPGGNMWGDYVYNHHLMVAKNGQVYLLWSHITGEQEDIYLITRAAAGGWSEPEIVTEDINWYDSPIVFDNNDQLYIVWAAAAADSNLYCSMRGSDGRWSTPQVLSDFTEDVYINGVGLYVNQWDQLHIIWTEIRPSYWSKIVYRQTKTVPSTGDSTLTQAITIPVQSAPPILSFIYQFDQRYSPPGASFEVSIQDGSTTTPLFQTGAASRDWTHAWSNLSAWAGKNINLVFNVHQVADYPFVGVYIDEVTLGAANPDAWVRGYPSAGLPGEQASFSIDFGNQGQAPASGNFITVTLPASLTFISANITPITTAITATNVLVWDLGDLPASSGPYSLVITVALAADIPLGSSLEIPVALAPVAAELELGNNASRGTIFVGRQIYLPLLVR